MDSVSRPCKSLRPSSQGNALDDSREVWCPTETYPVAQVFARKRPSEVHGKRYNKIHRMHHRCETGGHLRTSVVSILPSSGYDHVEKNP